MMPILLGAQVQGSEVEIIVSYRAIILNYEGGWIRQAVFVYSVDDTRTTHTR